MSELRTKRGQGSIRKLQSGRYQVRFTDPNGVRRSAKITFSKKFLAEAELQRVRGAIEAGTWHVDETASPGDLDPKTLTLVELGAYWRAQRVNSRGQQLSPNTLGEYERLITSTLAQFTDKPIRQITRQQIETWRAPEIKRAPNQTVKAYKHLKSLLDFAEKRHWIAKSPCDIERGTSYAPDEKPNVPSSEQVGIMLDSSNGAFKAVLALAILGGLRKGEILELRRKDLETVLVDGEKWFEVNVARGVIWERAKAIVRQPKTQTGIRRVLLPPTANAILTAHLKTVGISPNSLLFTRNAALNEHWGEFQINPEWRRVRQIAGYAGRFHSLRAFAATEFAKTGATTQELMDRFGHKDVLTAMRYQRSTGREAQLLQRLG